MKVYDGMKALLMVKLYTCKNTREVIPGMII